jgi:hypothetical protein
VRSFTLIERLEERMNKYVTRNGKTASEGAARKSFMPQDSADENLRKLVRRAVRSVAVPADLELKTLNLIRKKAQV